MKEELKQFDINIDDIEESKELFDNIHEAIHKMNLYTMKDRFEIVLNNNLIECKEKITNYRTIFGCRISYDNLPKDVSFIVREDVKPSYETLEDRIDKATKYIEDNTYSGDFKGDYYMFDEDINAKELLQILEGDKE